MDKADNHRTRQRRTSDYSYALDAREFSENGAEPSGTADGGLRPDQHEPAADTVPEVAQATETEAPLAGQPSAVPEKKPGGKHRRVRATLPQPAESDESEVESPTFITVTPALVRVCGGGLPALLAGLIDYWSSPASDGLARSRPQIPKTRPVYWAPGWRDIAEQLGLQVTPGSGAAEKRVRRAADYLLTQGLIQAGPEPPWRKFDGRPRRGLRLTEKFNDSVDTDTEEHDQNHFLQVYRDYTAELALTPNEAILLAYLHLRIVTGAKRLRVTSGSRIYFVKSTQRIAVESGLTEDMVRHAIGDRHAGLIGHDLVSFVRTTFRGSPHRHFEIPPAARKVLDRIHRRP